MLTVGIPMDFVAVYRIYGLKHLIAYLLESTDGTVVGKQPAAMFKRVGIFDRRRPDRCAAHMGDHCARINPLGRLFEMLAVIRGPGLLFDEGNAVRIASDAPTMPVGQPLLVTDALRHQRILCVDKTALDARRFVSVKSVEAAHVVYPEGLIVLQITIFVGAYPLLAFLDLTTIKAAQDYFHQACST